MATAGGDITFNLANTTYSYMVVEDNGRKQWSYQHLYSIPPSLIKGKVDVVILAAPAMRNVAGNVIATDTIANVLTQLRTLTDAVTDITLTGYDAASYKVLLDPKATQVRSALDETGRITRYEIAISCWERYTA